MKKMLTVSLLLISFSQLGGFGGFSISENLFNYILHILHINKTADNKDSSKIILELGSGWGSGQLAQYVTLHSVEHDFNFLNKYPTHYIYAPIVNYNTYRWYNIDILKKELPKKYDLILIDGPLGCIGRMGFYYNLFLFNTDVPIIFDDVHRKPELELMQNVAGALDRSYKVFDDGTGNQFGVVLP